MRHRIFGLALTLVSGCVAPEEVPYRDAGVGDSDGGFCALCVDESDCRAGAQCDPDTGTCTTPCSATEACPLNAICADDGFEVSCQATAALCGVSAQPAWLDCTDTWDTFGSPFFAEHCNSCHSFATDGNVIIEVVRPVIYSRRMPERELLSPNDRRRLLMWLECGAH